MFPVMSLSSGVLKASTSRRGGPWVPSRQPGQEECAVPPRSLGVELPPGSLQLQCYAWAHSAGISLCSFQEFAQALGTRGVPEGAAKGAR